MAISDLQGTATAPSAGYWRRWKRIAQRAAEVQSEILLFILFALLVPPAVVAQLFTRFHHHKSGWRSREPTDVGLAEARRQF